MLGTVSGSQTVGPTTTFALQSAALLNARDSKIIATSDAVYALAEEGDGTWLFDKITNLANPTPLQNSLSIRALTRDQTGRLAGFLATNLIVTPNARYALIRIWGTPKSLGSRQQTRADFAVVDLSKFEIVSTSSRTDPEFSGMLD